MKNILIVVHPPVEFIYALHFTANIDNMDKFFLQFNYVQAEEVKQKVGLMQNKLTRYMTSELDYFFEWAEIKHVLGRIAVENLKLSSVSDFIDYIEKIDCRVLSSYIINQNYSDIPAKQECINSLLTKEADKIMEIILNSEFREDSIKEKLIECVENPEEIKLRLCLLLRQFYQKCYAPIENEILNTLATFKERYEKLYNEDSTYFFNEYIKRYSNAEDRKFIIHIGYFIQVRPWLFYIPPIDNIEWINIGMYSEQFPKSYMEKERVKKFLRLLADNKRFEMVELLAKKEWYGHELAAELKLTPPTVFYHMNSLLDLNLVSFEKEGNKTYYKLNKERLEELSQAIIKVVLDK